MAGQSGPLKPRQMPRAQPDWYSAWFDLSNPQAPGKETEPEDIIHPDRPTGPKAAFSVGDRVRCADPKMDAAYGHHIGTVEWCSAAEDSYDVRFDSGSGGMFHGRMLIRANDSGGRIRWFV